MDGVDVAGDVLVSAEGMLHLFTHFPETGCETRIDAYRRTYNLCIIVVPVTLETFICNNTMVTIHKRSIIIMEPFRLPEDFSAIFLDQTEFHFETQMPMWFFFALLEWCHQTIEKEGKFLNLPLIASSIC